MWTGIVKVEKSDPKKLIWLKITYNKLTFRLVSCYFTPKNSKLYKRKNLDKEDRYVALKRDIVDFKSLGGIVLINEFNDRTTNNQCIQWGSEGNLDNNLLWLEEN